MPIHNGLNYVGALPVDTSKVTMRQARIALRIVGLLDDVDAAVAAMAGIEGDLARIEWEYSGEVWRNKALVKSLGPVLGLSESQLDDLFALAASFKE